MTFGKRLKKLVKAKGMTCALLAVKMNVDPAYVSQLVIGHRKPGQATLLKLAKALDVNMDVLMMLESRGYEQIRDTRRVPILRGTKIVEWLQDNEACPLFFNDLFEYAATCDPRAFYVRTKDFSSCCGLEDFDLFLVEPNSAIENGSTVLVLSAKGLSVRRLRLRDKTMLLSDVEEKALHSEENDLDDTKLFRIKECIKKL